MNCQNSIHILVHHYSVRTNRRLKMSAEEEITLLSAEGEKFTVPKRVAQMSELVKLMTEDGECSPGACRQACANLSL